MREIVRAFAADVSANFPIRGPVVEIGARAAEGQEQIADIRLLFGEHEYIGCDIQDGPGVDRIEDVHHLSFADETIGAVVCLDTLEHVADPIRALEEMHRVLVPGGLVAISSVMFFPIHAHPWDYWRFTPEGFSLLLSRFTSRLVLAHGWEPMPETVFGVGVKGEAVEIGRDRLPSIVAAIDAWGAHTTVDLGPIRMTVRELWRMTLHYTAARARTRLHGLLRRSAREG